MITIIALIFIFGLIVFSHELGHFIAAKLMGVSVHTFAFGFPPRIWSKKIGETEYAINALPLGGYVTLLGEEELENGEGKAKDDPKNLLSKKPWQLILIFGSGVLMNFLLAVVLLYICYLAGFKPIAPGMADYPGIVSTQKVVVTQVEKNAPAEAQGIKTGDSIISANGTKTVTGTDVIGVISDVSKQGKSTVDIVIKRGNETISKQITTYKSKVGGSEVTRIGVTLEDQGVIRGNVISGLSAAFQEVFKLLALTFAAIINLFVQLFFTFRLSNDVSGPVGIVLATSYFANLGFIALLQFAAVLSISLAVFNILPIPALDGGHILFAILELVTRRKISQKVKNSTALVGFGLLILLMIAVTVKDFFTFDIIGMIRRMF